MSFILQDNKYLFEFLLVLPGMDGVELIRKIHQYQNIPVIAMTGHPVEEDSLKSYTVNELAVRWFSKPFPPEELTESVNKLLGS